MEEKSSRIIEGKHAIAEALKAGRDIDRLFIVDEKNEKRDAVVSKIVADCKKAGTPIDYISKERLQTLSETGKNQGLIAYLSSASYVEVSDILDRASKRKEAPFIILLDDIEDPHNLGAIIRTANVAGAHGVIIPKRRSAGLTATVEKASAGAVSHTLIARVSNLTQTIEKLKKDGIWFVCADMNGETMYDVPLTGPIGLVVGNEGKGVSRLVREACDYVASIPMKGEIESLNASVACAVLTYEIVRQRTIDKTNNDIV
ncbi:MAG: 23S rRNA (guanosine(2251)-2'-O)-methyltransferase RlmB [Lachnospiraceae bacterium]|jgi:23S rRNA (guanosine2251-2'-O)-methyltransferase|nr:23S rRNA (guanosine(2251)-2'-O)-methyltransferase RlmB [Lachnospiraceae bacterium]